VRMKVDKRKFDEVLGKLIKAEPQKRAEFPLVYLHPHSLAPVPKRY